MRVEVAYVGTAGEALVALDVPPGTTAADAAAQSRILERADAPPGIGYAIFGRRVDPSTPLADGDRVEITRPLACDPKLARRHRAARRR